MKKIQIIVWLFILFSVGSISAEVKNKFIAYPNPFQPSKTFLSIRNADKTEITGDVSITIYNSLMRKIYSQKFFETGSNTIRWDGLNIEGELVNPGLYFIQIIQSTFDSDNTINIEVLKVLVQ